jgi:sugar lactone lactonase YvrE
MKVPVDGGDPIALAEYPHACAVAIDTSNVYFATCDGGLVGKVPIEGGDLVQLAFDQDQPDAVVVDADSVYWTTADAILKVSIHGGDPSPVAVEQSPLGTFAVAEGSVFWTNGPAGTIARVSVDGGPVAVLATSDGYAQGATVDSSFVYWATNLGEIRKTAIATGVTTELATGENNPGNPALGGGFLYWPEIVAFDARIRRVGL